MEVLGSETSEFTVLNESSRREKKANEAEIKTDRYPVPLLTGCHRFLHGGDQDPRGFGGGGTSGFFEVSATRLSLSLRSPLEQRL